MPPPRKALCPRGLHDMDRWGVQQWKTGSDGERIKNGRYCRICRREREAPGALQRHWDKEFQEALREDST